MATSGSWDYSLTAADIIQAALEDLLVVQDGSSISSGDSALGLKTLNLLVKQWQGTADMAQGFKVFLRQFVYVFLQKNQAVYQIGPASGDDNATTSYSSTTISAAEAAAQTTLSVTSTTGMTAADKIGIQLDSGSIQWTTISSTGAGPTVVIPASGLTGAAAAGNRVFWYTSKAQRMTDVLSAVLRNTSTQDTPLRFIKTAEEYELFSDKTATGDPTRIMVEPLRITTKLTLDTYPQDVTKVIRLLALYPSEDYDATTNDIAYPQEWFAALEYELARRLAPKFNAKWTPELQACWQDATQIARQLTPQVSTAYFEPGRD